MRFIVVLSCLLSCLVLAACSPSLPESYQPLPTGVTIEDFKLYNQDGQTVETSALKDKWTLAFYGFTFCPDVCPTTLAELNQAARKIERDDLQVVLISVDPGRDNPEQLKNYIEYFNPKFQAWSGELVQLQSLARQMHIFFQKTPYGEDSYLMDHSSQVVVINPQGQYQGFFTAPLKVDEIAGYMNSL